MQSQTASEINNKNKTINNIKHPPPYTPLRPNTEDIKNKNKTTASLPLPFPIYKTKKNKNKFKWFQLFHNYFLFLKWHDNTGGEYVELQINKAFLSKNFLV